MKTNDSSMPKLTHITLSVLGLNEVDVPRGGKVLAVATAVHTDAPLLAILHEPDAPAEKREFFLTTGPMPVASPIKIGAYVGFAQFPGHLPTHIFEANSH